MKEAQGQWRREALENGVGKACANGESKHLDKGRQKHRENVGGGSQWTTGVGNIGK